MYLYSTSHVAHKFHEKNKCETLVKKYTRKDTRENTCKLGKFVRQTCVLKVVVFILGIRKLFEFLRL